MAANQDNKDAQYQLAQYYENEIEGVFEKDLVKSSSYIKKVADKGYPYAQHSMVRVYMNGIGTEKNFQRAFEYCKSAANQGNIKAKKLLALSFYDFLMIELEADSPKVLKWTEFAAGLGNDKAQYYMGMAYMTGKGAEKNLSKAIKFFELRVNNRNARNIDTHGYVKNEVAVTQLTLLQKHIHDLSISMREAIKNRNYEEITRTNRC